MFKKITPSFLAALLGLAVLGVLPALAYYNMGGFWKTSASLPTLSWTWVSGSSTISQSGVYGTKGTPAANNTPGARSESISWIDSSDNLWLFGGFGYDAFGSFNFLNDLWKWNGTQWAWISGPDYGGDDGNYGTKGVGSTSNIPGARYGATSWIDASGNLWLFGGQGYASTTWTGYLDDVWKYTPGNNEWTWIYGQSSTDDEPMYGVGVASSSIDTGGLRDSMAAFTNSGQAWLYGGYGYDSSGFTGRHANLWRYSSSTNLFTWYTRAANLNTLAVYGTKGVAATTTWPGSTEGPVGWADSSNNFWFFGGNGYSDSTGGLLNTLWKAASSSIGGWPQWTWVSGSSSVDWPGTYGTKGTPAANNAPGGRYNSTGWKDAAGNFWLFGGYGYADSSLGFLSDMWAWNGSQWAWMNGSSTPNWGGTYGTKGTPALTNAPGGRQGSISWRDSAGSIWIFGGYGFDKNSGFGRMNDLWRYVP